MKKAFLEFFLFALICVSLPAFSKQDIVSPVEGTWSNFQPLVLNVEDSSEVFYSVSGSDPLMFGFAYDGPTVIEQTGDVHLCISVISSAGIRTDYSVDYKVILSDESGKSSYSEIEKKFIDLIKSNSIRAYTAGTPFVIPDTFSYAIGMADERSGLRFFKGRSLTFSSNNTVERYVPFTVKANSELYRFIVKTLPSQKAYVKSVLHPFKVFDWNTISFAKTDFLYKIDDGNWTDPMFEIHIDRTETHVVFWKARDAADSEASSFVLYPKPKLECISEKDNTVSFVLRLTHAYLDGYKMGAVSSQNHALTCVHPAEGFYDKLALDAFYGEEACGTFTTGVYLNGIYQGNLSHSYDVDKLPPPAPVIASSSAEELVLFSTAKVSFYTENNAKIFYAVSQPVPFEGRNAKSMEWAFEKIQAGKFTALTRQDIFLSSVNDCATFYKIRAYAQDASGNIGDISEFHLIVDGHNLYVDERMGSDKKGTGGYASPFASIEKALSVCKSGTKIHIKGLVTVVNPIEVKIPCTIEGDDSVVIFGSGAVITFVNCTSSVCGCAFTKDSESEDDSLMISLQKSNVSFSGCDISSSFVRNGTLLNLADSHIYADKCNFSLTAASYSNVISAHNSFVSIRNTSCAANSYTAVCFSVSDCTLELNSVAVGASGFSGRIAEISGGEYSISNNIFTVSFADTNINMPVNDNRCIWTSSSSRQKVLQNNKINGIRK